MTVSALLGVTYDAIIDSLREYDLVAIEMLVAVPHGNRHKIEHRDSRSSQSEINLSITISALTDTAYGAVIYSRPGCDLVATEMSPFIR